MEENAIVQSVSVLLYSRTLDTLYLEVHDSKTKMLVDKLYVNTSSHAWLNLAMTLSTVEIMVKKNEENVQIFHEFGILSNKSSHPPIVESMGHYIKMKKKFPNFELLFQIFLQSKSSFNSIQSLTPTTPDLSTNPIKNLASQQQRKQLHLNQLREMAQVNLNLLINRAMSIVVIAPKKKNSVPSEQSGTRSFRRRKDKKTFTYNARINKLKKDEGKKMYLTPSGLKQKHRARSEKEMFDTTRPHDEATESSNLLLKRTTVNTFLLKKPTSNFDKFNNDDHSSQATKQSNTHRGMSKSKMTLLNQSFSIGNKCQYSSPPLLKYCSQNKPIVEQKPEQLSRSIHQKIVEESCLKKIEREEFKVNNEIFYQRKKRVMEVQTQMDNLLNNLQVLCIGRETGRCRRSNSRIIDVSNLRGMSRSQEVKEVQPQLSLTKKCSNLTKLSNEPQNSTRNVSKFKQHFYEDLYLKTLESIQNQTQILHYIQAHCQALNSVSVKRQKRQQTRVKKAKENVNLKMMNEVTNNKRESDVGRKAKEGYLAKVQQLSVPIKYLKC